MEALFQNAVKNRGQEYLAAESALRNSPESVAVLRANLQNADPIARLIATVLLDWKEGRAPEYQQALDFLEALPKRLAKTPVGMPPPTGVAADLAERFGSRIAGLIAVRLVKESPAPHWRVLTYVFYLESQALPETTPALIRFAAESENPKWRSAAIQAISKIRDPHLKDKIAAERARLQAEQKLLPPDLATLEGVK